MEPNDPFQKGNSLPSSRTELIARVYAAFEAYELEGKLLACECPSCVSADAKSALIATPVRDISRDLLAEYTHSAHGRSPDQELKHFLPRYIELILDGQPPSHWGIETVLTRLGLAPWRSRWPSHEVQVLDEAFDCVLQTALIEEEALAKEPIESILMLLFGAHADLPRLCERWTELDTPFAVRRLAQAVIAGRARVADQVLELREAWGSFLAWASSPVASVRLEAALMTAVPQEDELYINAIKAP